MSFERALIILRKDLVWAKQNSKLLALMVTPVFLMIFLSKVGDGAAFGFSLAFINAFVGIFSTSYLITEEKHKGTLVSLLTTPLKGSELLFGKFLFNLILCLGFTLLSLVLNDRFDLLVRPFALLNCILFAGTTCFFGYTLGVFFKNEKEMSVLAPFILLFFAMGDALEGLSQQIPIGGFFPSYHLIQSVREVSPSGFNIFLHLFFSLLLFLATFFMATSYTQFYFSNHRDGKRFSKGLIFSLLAFFGVLGISGFYTMEKNEGLKVDEAGRKTFKIEKEAWDVTLRYDESRFYIKKVIETKGRKGYLVKDNEGEKIKIFLSVRKLGKEESSFKKRHERVRGNYKKIVVAEEVSPKFNYPARTWVYIYKGEQTFLQEVICEDEIFQWGLDQDLKKMNNYEENLKVFTELSKYLEIQCKGTTDPK